MKFGRLAAFALVSAGLVVGQMVYAPSAQAAEQVLDGSFEATVLGDSPNWDEDDSIFGSPLCDDSCGVDGARTGDWWSWFGGDDTAGHNGSLSQSVIIPAGTHALSYYYEDAFVTAPFTTTLTVKIDTTTVKTHTESAVADDDYSQILVNVAPFADGLPHTLSFNYLNVDAGSASIFVDDVSIDTTLNPTATGMPTVTSATPAGPSTATTTNIVGTADAGSTVTLYGNSTCTGAPLGSGTAAAFVGAGIPVTVPSDATTTIYAQATNSGQFDSACSTTSVSYVNDMTVPNTTIATPVTGAVVKALTVPITFSSTEAGSTFTCSLDTAPFTACTSPKSVTVTAGAHTFRVAAKDAALNEDTTPASVTFTAYDCTTLNAAVTAAQAKADAAAKKAAKAKKALKKAKKSHNAKKIKKAKKKLKKAKAAVKAAQAELSTATGAAAPCGGTTAKLAARR